MTYCLWEVPPESPIATHDQELFCGQDPNRPINPGEAMEYGAAGQGEILTGEGVLQSAGLCYRT